ncbi:MAG: OmpA family protein [Bacteroidales bacterium]
MLKYSLFFLFVIVTGIILPEPVFSQSRRLQRADNAFELEQYSEALELYDKAYRRARRRDRKEGARIVFQMAMCYRYTNQARRAEITFKRAIRQNYPDPVAQLYMAQAMLQNEKYEDAIEEFEKYLEKVPEDSRAKLGIESAKYAMEVIENPGRYEIDAIRKINSRQSDFTPAFADHRQSSLVFASTRDGVIGEQTDPWTGENFSSLFITYQDRQGDWSKPVLLDEGPVNTKFNEGAPSFNATYTEMYFTSCQNAPNAKIGCRIYRSKLNGAKWGEPEMLNLVEDSTISIGHPAISPDELTLYFVSDMPGGKGGNDIWVATRENPSAEFSQIKNLDTIINTPGNEMFPYVRHDGVMYFASDGHPGLGGLDIFYSMPDGDSWSEPVNFGPPISSPGDDFGIDFIQGEESGFFSSIRDRRGLSNVYYFNLPPLLFTISGTVRDDQSKKLISDVTVQLIGSDGTLLQKETDEEGRFLFNENEVNQDTKYDILVSKEKYFASRGQETTEEINRSRDFVHEFYLEPIPETPIELPEILYDFASWELKEQYQDSLMGLVQTLEDNPGLIIELASHTDSRGAEEYNDTLSQKRAKAVVDFLVDRGIDERRLVAKGYGKRVPRLIEDTIVRDGYVFEEGIELDEDYINSLETEEHRDVAHQLNRRTEFKVLSEDFDPGEEEGEDEPVKTNTVPNRRGGRESENPQERRKIK